MAEVHNPVFNPWQLNNYPPEPNDFVGFGRVDHSYSYTKTLKAASFQFPTLPLVNNKLSSSFTFQIMYIG